MSGNWLNWNCPWQTGHYTTLCKEGRKKIGVVACYLSKDLGKLLHFGNWLQRLYWRCHFLFPTCSIMRQTRMTMCVKCSQQKHVSIVSLENRGFWVQIRLRCQLLVWPCRRLLNFIAFVCSSENKRGNADPSILWRLISF